MVRLPEVNDGWRQGRRKLLQSVETARREVGGLQKHDGFRAEAVAGVTGFYAPRIMSAALSAIITVGALVLPPISVGITEASITRRPSRPCTFMLSGATTAMSSMPILQVPTG